MMKKIILPLATVALLTTTCDMNVKDSDATFTYGVYNLIENLQDPSATALATEGVYKVHQNATKWTVDIAATEMIIDNKKYTFETDTMGIKPKIFNDKVAYMGFSSTGNVGKGATITDLNGFVATSYVPASSNVLSPNYEFEHDETVRLILDYTLNDQYRVKTFLPLSCYVGDTYVTEGSASFSTEKTGYLVNIDFAKKTAEMYALGFKLGSLGENSAPAVIYMEEIPVTISHDGYRIEAANPKCSVPGVVDKKSQFVATTKYNVTDLSLDLTSDDMTDVQITYKVDGKKVYFKGCSINKTGK